MQNLKKKLLILFVLLLLPIMTGCVTKTKQNKSIILPPKPERQELKLPETTKDYAEMIIYYEYLVREWEAWGDAVSDLIENN